MCCESWGAETRDRSLWSPSNLYKLRNVGDRKATRVPLPGNSGNHDRESGTLTVACLNGGYNYGMGVVKPVDPSDHLAAPHVGIPGPLIEKDCARASRDAS